MLNWLTGQRVQYSIGFTLPGDFAAQVKILDKADAWQAALDAEQQIRPDPLVADATGLLDLTPWPAGMRVIVRKEKPHPGAQLRITDVNGWRAPRSQPTPPPSADRTDPAPTSNYATAAAPAARTASASPKTPA